MSWFQILALSALGLLLARDLWYWSRVRAGRFVRTLRSVAWAGAAVAIAIPDIVTLVALGLGIGRGADVVLYVSVLGFLWAAFFLYARCLRLEREITSLTRHLAIRDAVRGPVRGGYEPGNRAAAG